MLGALAEAAEIDDAPHAGGCRGGGEVRSPAAVALGEVPVRLPAHRVDQVVGDADSLQRLVEAGSGPSTSAWLSSQPCGGEVLGSLRPPGERPHLLAPGREPASQEAADVAGRAGYDASLQPVEARW